MSKNRPRSKNRQTHTKKRKQHVVKKERGILLIAAIILVIIHGLAMVGIIYGQQLLRSADAPPTWFVLSIIVAAIADIVAGVALWQWKKWGLTLYLVATIIVVALGIMATGYGMMWAFSRIIPFAIVGYIVRLNWRYFE